MIRIYAWMTDGSACDWYRCVSPLSTLERRYPGQYKVEWSHTPPPSWHPFGREHFDIVVGQRLAGDQPAWRELCARDDVVTVYDLDDDLLDVDPANTTPHAIYAPMRAGTLENIQRATVVTVSTATLAEKIRAETGHERVHVLPNCAAEHLLAQARIDSHTTSPREGVPLVIGWAGSAFHGQDWQHTGCGEALRRLYRVYGNSLRFVSMGGHFVGDYVPATLLPLVGIGDHYLRLRQLDIGLAPLYDTAFNDCKSECKALEYAAAGAVPVCSPRAPYKAWAYVDDARDHWPAACVVRDDSAESWFTALDSLITSPMLRSALREAAYEKAREYTIERQVHRWHQVYQEAANNR
jgi:glycosyltransferase involved in cell wall biosynthesis